MVNFSNLFVESWTKPIGERLSKRNDLSEDNPVHCMDDTPITLLDETVLNEEEKSIFSFLRFLMNDDFKLKMVGEMFRSVLIKRDPKIFENVCGLTQRILDSLWSQLRENNNPEFHKKIDAVIGSIISILPFFDPELISGGQIRIPQKIGNVWHRVTFNIGKTSLKPQSSFGKFAAKFFGESIDIVELDPADNEEARPIRSFMGTTFPAGKGMIQTVLADTFPFGSVGEMFFIFTKRAIEKSLNKSKKKVDIYGQSLGGAMALLTSVAFPEKVDHVNTYGAPKLVGSSISKYLINKKENFTPKVTCYVNENDLVCKAGNALPPNARTILVLGEKVLNAFSAHAKILAVQKRIVMVNLNSKKVKGWSVIGVIHRIVSPIIFTVIAALWIVWRLLVTLFYTLPKAGIDALRNKRSKNRAKQTTLPT